jgi:hypothetical protein
MPTVYEKQDSRQYTYNYGKATAQRTFIVLDAENEGEVCDLFGSTLPDKYNAYPGDASLPTEMVCRDFTIKKISGKPNAWEITYDYTVLEPLISDFTNPHTPNKEPGNLGYRTFSATVSSQFVDFYRDPSDCTSAASCQAAGTAVDIGGTPIDKAGYPVSRLSNQIAWTITVTLEQLPSAQQVYDQMGTRNSAIFLGFPIGSILFQGYDAQAQENTGNASCTFRFLLDEFFHMRQYAERNVDGSIQLGDEGTAYASASGDVRWVQPFTELSYFQSLSPFLFNL